MQPISVIFDITKVTDYSRTQGVCHVFFSFVGSFLGKVSQPAFTCLSLTIKAPEQGVKYVQS